MKITKLSRNIYRVETYDEKGNYSVIFKRTKSKRANYGKLDIINVVDENNNFTVRDFDDRRLHFKVWQFITNKNIYCKEVI